MNQNLLPAPQQDNDNTQDDQPQPSLDELLARVTHPKQRLFLDNFPKFGEITKCAEACGTTGIIIPTS